MGNSTQMPNPFFHYPIPMDGGDAEASTAAYLLLLRSLCLIPASHYLLAAILALLVLSYTWLEIHFLGDLFGGDPVTLTFHPSSPLFHSVAANCRLLRHTYSPTPWLSSPHLQTLFLSLFDRPPKLTYTRNLFTTPDGGTLALDWLLPSHGTPNMNDADNTTPIVIVVPGLTSDSHSAYVKRLALRITEQGWNVVVSNHRGLGGISITSDCFYSAGWTEDIRKVIDHIHHQYPEAPLFAVGTSVGANILVKFLGEDGANIPLIGAAAVCSPWDPLICDRFMNRRFVQKLYSKVLAVGLQGYARLHQSVLSKLADWKGIEKSRSVRDFDNHATRILGKFETVDTYYRQSTSARFVGNVMVPLLCISALDDPVCTSEAIPWDECRTNENVILATTSHGGHLAYYEGVTASSVWWVRVVAEFFSALHSTPSASRRKVCVDPVEPAMEEMETCTMVVPSKSSLDQAPYVKVAGNGMVMAAVESSTQEDASKEHVVANEMGGGKLNSRADEMRPAVEDWTITTVSRHIHQLSRHSKISLWLLAYIAIVTTWRGRGVPYRG